MNEYLNIVKKVISEKVGVEFDEINDNSYFEEDLNTGAMELLEILEDLEEKFQIDLVEGKDKIETVSDLADAISEKLD